jgi:hypothetical protein
MVGRGKRVLKRRMFSTDAEYEDARREVYRSTRSRDWIPRSVKRSKPHSAFAQKNKKSRTKFKRDFTPEELGIRSGDTTAILGHQKYHHGSAQKKYPRGIAYRKKMPYYRRYRKRRRGGASHTHSKRGRSAHGNAAHAVYRKDASIVRMPMLKPPKLSVPLKTVWKFKLNTTLTDTDVNGGYVAAYIEPSMPGAPCGNTGGESQNGALQPDGFDQYKALYSNVVVTSVGFRFTVMPIMSTADAQRAVHTVVVFPYKYTSGQTRPGNMRMALQMPHSANAMTTLNDVTTLTGFFKSYNILGVTPQDVASDKKYAQILDSETTAPTGDRWRLDLGIESFSRIDKDYDYSDGVGAKPDDIGMAANTSLVVKCELIQYCLFTSQDQSLGTTADAGGYQVTLGADA